MGGLIERLAAEDAKQRASTVPDRTDPDSTEIERLEARQRANVPAQQEDPVTPQFTEVYAEDNPERAARILRARRSTGLAHDVITRNLDDIEKAQRSKPLDLDELSRSSPAIAAWMAADPAHMSVVRPDVEKMSYLERQLRNAGQEFGSGVATVKLTRIGLAAMMGQATEEHRAEQAAIEHDLGDRVDYGIGQGLRPVLFSRGPEGDAMYAAIKAAVPGLGAIFGGAELAEQIPGAAAQQLPITGMELGTKALGAGVGAVGGSLAGPGGTVAGATIGWKVGAIPSAAIMEASTAYLDYEKLRDERGQPLDRKLILGAAIVTGAVNGTLEALSLEQLAKTLPGIRTLGRKGMRELLAKQTTRQALEHALKAIGESAATEGTTEFLQEYVTNLAGRIVQLNQSGRAMSVGEFLEQTVGDPQFFQQALESGKGGFLAAIGTGGAGGALTVAGQAMQIRKAERRADIFKAIADGAQDSELLKRMPEAHQELVSRMTKDGPLEHAYIPVERFTEYFQGANLDPADVAAELTGSREAYDEAQRTGGLLRIPTAAYATKLAATEHHGKLIEDITFSPDELSMREARELSKQLDEQTAAAAEQAAPVTDAAERVTDVITTQLRRAGFNEKTARTYASALYGSPLRVLASRGAAANAEELLNRFNLAIRGPGSTELAPLPTANIEAIRQAHIATRTAALEKQGKVIDVDGTERFAGPRTEGGARRDVERVSTRGLLTELLDLEEKQADAENRSVYELREDPNFHTEGIPQIVATRKGVAKGGPSQQAKALQNLEDFRRIRDQVHAELEKRGLVGTDVFDALEDLRAELDERAAMEGDIPVQRGGADVFQDEEGRDLFQTATIAGGDETLEEYGLEPGRTYTNREVAAALEARQREKYGTIAKTDRSPAASRKIAKWMTAEIMHELKDPERSGLGWYGAKFQRALDVLASRFPELADDLDARDTMTALIAVSSDGALVKDNFRIAMEAYASFRETGQFTPQRSHRAGASHRRNFAKIQELYDAIGPEGMRDFLLEQLPISQLSKEARLEGSELNTEYEAHVLMPRAVIVFGPKLGAFYANLMGQANYLTMDRWWSRTFNRYRGTLLTAPTKTSLAAFRELIGQPQLSDDETLSAAAVPTAELEGRNFKTRLALLVGRSEEHGKEKQAKWMAEARKAAGADFDALLQEHRVERAANTITRAAFEQLEDTPFNAGDRTFMLATVERARALLRSEHGYNVTAADVQAILWYYEKKLYGQLTNARRRGIEGVSYVDVARELVGADDAGGSERSAVPGDRAAARGGSVVSEQAPGYLDGAKALAEHPGVAAVIREAAPGRDTNEDLQRVVTQIANALGLEDFHAYITPATGDIELASIRVRRGERKQGTGTRAVQLLTAYADHVGRRLTLDAAERDPTTGTTSRARLVRFYKRFGFQENKGRKRDFTTRRQMIRPAGAAYQDPKILQLRMDAQSNLVDVAHSFGSLEAVGAAATELARAAPLVVKIREAGLPTSPDRIEAIRPVDRRAWVDLRGIQIRSAQHAAQLLHAFRNPRMERMHVLLLDDEGRILSHSMETSGAIGYVQFGDDFAPRIIARAKRVGATRAMISHNHPSGEHTPSSDDIAYTGSLGYDLQQAGIFLDAHIVTDHTKASVIAPNRALGGHGGLAVDEVPILGVRLGERGEFDWTAHATHLGSLRGPQHVAQMVRDVVPERGFLALYLDSQHRPVAVEPHTDASVLHIDNWLPARRKANAARYVIFAGERRSVEPIGRLIGHLQEGATPGAGVREHWSQHVLDVIIFESGRQRIVSAAEQGVVNARPEQTPVPSWRVFEGDNDRRYGVEGAEQLEQQRDEPAEQFDPAELRVPEADVFGATEQGRGLEGTDVAGGVPEVPGVRLSRAVEEALARRELEQARHRFLRTAIEIRSFPDERRQELIDALKREPYMLEQGAGIGPRGRIRIGDNSMEIELLENANLSTFIHETGHFYLEVLGSIASQENAPPEIAADYATLLAHLGATPGEALTRQQHETFARTFEAYLLEGNAPSAELRTAFARFRTWLVMLYKSVRGLRVALTPEVRGVLDRLFATDEEIAAAQQELGAMPLFADPAAAGMAQNVAQAYGAALERAQESAATELATKALVEITREQKAWWKDERERTRAEVAAQVYAEPASIARIVLQKGTLPDGSPLPEGLPAVKLDRRSIVEAYGKELPRQLPRGLYAKEGGISADDAATVFGFRTGGELLQALLSSEKLSSRIDRLTDERMKQEHGDMLTDGSLPERAMQAVHNEDRARVLRLELEHLVSDDLATAKKMITTLAGSPTAMAPTKESIDRRGRRRRIPTVEQIRDQARRTIAAKLVRDIQPQLYRQAETKASRLAIEAFTKGDFAQAFEEKSRELLSHELYRAAVAAREEAERIADYLRGFDKTSTRARIGKALGGYLEQIDALRERYSFTRATRRELGKRASLRDFVAREAAEGRAIDVPEALVDEAHRQHWQETSLEELQGLRDTVEQLEHLARTKNTLLANEAKRNLEDARAELAAGAAEHFNLEKEPVDITRPTRGELVKNAKGWVASHTRMEFLFSRLDGFKPNGPFWTYFFQPFARAEDLENDMRRRDAEAMKEILAKYSRAERRAWFTRRIEVPAAATSRIKGTFTKANVLAIALNWGNQYNRDALMEGYGWNEAQVEKILATLDRRDAEFVQAIWDHIDTYWPAAQQLETEITGLAPQKVEASPTTIAGVELRGGYYPIAFDREQSSKQMALDLSASVDEMAKGYGGRAMTRHGHLIERTSTGGRPLLLELSVINKHLAQVTHDLSHRRAVIDAMKLIKDPQITDTIERAVGPELYQQLGPWLSSIAGDVPTNAVQRLERVAARARSGVTAVNLGLNLTSSLVQTLGYFNATNEIGPKYAALGMRDAYGKPWRIRETWDFVTSRSSSMRDRLGNFDREVRDIARKPGALDTLGVDPSFIYQLIGWMDMGVSIPSWLGAYRKAMDGAQEGITGGDERAAIDYADSVVRTTQAAGAAKDLAQVQRGAEWWKLNTAFYSSMSVLFNQFARIPQQYAIDKNPAKVLAAVVLTWFLPAVLEDALRGRGPDDDDDELTWALKKIAFYPLSTVVLLRDFASAMQRTLETGRPSAGSNAYGQILESVVKTGKAVADAAAGDDVTRADLREAFNTVGYFAKWPTRQLWKSGEYFHDWWTGDTSPRSPLEAFWGIATGTPKEDRAR